MVADRTPGEVWWEAVRYLACHGGVIHWSIEITWHQGLLIDGGIVEDPEVVDRIPNTTIITVRKDKMQALLESAAKGDDIGAILLSLHAEGLVFDEQSGIF